MHARCLALVLKAPEEEVVIGAIGSRVKAVTAFGKFVFVFLTIDGVQSSQAGHHRPPVEEWEELEVRELNIRRARA